MTAIVYGGRPRYLRQKFKRVTRSRWKGAIAWYCVLAIGGFFRAQLYLSGYSETG